MFRTYTNLTKNFIIREKLDLPDQKEKKENLVVKDLQVFVDLSGLLVQKEIQVHQDSPDQ